MNEIIEIDDARISHPEDVEASKKYFVVRNILPNEDPDQIEKEINRFTLGEKLIFAWVLFLMLFSCIYIIFWKVI